MEKNKNFVDTIKFIRNEYFSKISKISEKKFITDKLPGNFKWIGFILNAMPESKILHLERNPMAICWSIYKSEFNNPDMAFTYSQEYIAEYYLLYKDLMNFWKNKYPSQFINITYERFVEDYQNNIKKIFQKLDLEWEDHLLEFYKNKRPVETSSFQQVRKKIYQKSSEEWKKYKNFLKPMMEVLSKNNIDYQYTMKNLDNLINKALQLHKEGKFQDAINLYSDVLENKKNDSQLLFLIGTAYIQQGKIEKGIQELKKSISLKPENVFAHSNLGNALKDLKRYDEALTSYDKALQINPNYADIHNNRGSILKKLKKYNEALASYEKALQLNPDHAYTHNNKGNALKDLKRYEEAIASYNKAIQLNPNYADAYNNKGNVLKDLKLYVEALISFDEAIKIKPDHFDAYNNRGIVFNEIKYYEKALDCFDKALQINPNYAFAYNNKKEYFKRSKSL